MSNKPTKEQEYDGSTMLRSVMQEAVLDSILADTFQTDAYMEHYPSCKSKRVAEAAASRLLSNVKVKARLKYKREQLARKFKVDAERITRERVKIGFANISDFVDEKGQIRPITEIERDNLAAVSEIKLDPDGNIAEFKFHSKQTALDGLSKQIGAYEKDNEQKRDSIFDILAVVGLKAGDDRLPPPVLTAPVGTQSLESGDNDV